jgi:hypothetical protein
MKFGTSDAETRLQHFGFLAALHAQTLSSLCYCARDRLRLNGLKKTLWEIVSPLNGNLPLSKRKMRGKICSATLTLSMGMSSVSTSRTTDFLSEIADGSPIPAGKLAYFEARLRNELYNFVIGKFVEKEARGELTRAKLARRIGYDPGQLSRVLGAPGNWTLNTISNLLLGIAAEELKPQSESVLNRTSRHLVPDWAIHQLDVDSNKPRRRTMLGDDPVEQRPYELGLSR